MKSSDQFFKDASKLNSFGPSWIHNSYKEFIDFFKSNEKITEHNFIIGAYFTYGWMPTMLDLEDDISDAVKIANKAKIVMITDGEMETLARAVNGSYVGASKLLHFINPEVYAIWDSRVYRYLYDEPPYQYRLESMEKYREYLGLISDIKNDSRCQKLIQKVEHNIHYNPSHMRVIELVMYLCGSK